MVFVPWECFNMGPVSLPTLCAKPRPNNIRLDLLDQVKLFTRTKLLAGIHWIPCLIPGKVMSHA
jgi:hypothetical protein